MKTDRLKACRAVGKDEPERVIQAVRRIVEEARAAHPGGRLPENGVDTRHP